MAIVSGISVYVLLTIFGMLVHESAHSTNHNRQHYIPAQHDRGVLNVREFDGLESNHVKVISSEAGKKQNVLVAAPAEEENQNFIFAGHVPEQDENQSPDKLDRIANLLRNVEAKMNDGEDKDPDVRHDIMDIKMAIKELVGKKGDVEVHQDQDGEEGKVSSLLEQPKDAEAPGKVTIDELPYLQDPNEVPSVSNHYEIGLCQT